MQGSFFFFFLLYLKCFYSSSIIVFFGIIKVMEIEKTNRMNALFEFLCGAFDRQADELY